MKKKNDEKMYFRLRGTNHALDTPHQTDACGNPLADAKGENNAAKAFEDLWFYSNPIFVTNTNPNSLQKVNNNALRIHPNPAKNSVTIETNEEIKHIRVLTLNGQEIISQKNNTQVDLSTVEEGVYLICVETATDNYTERMVVKK